MTKLPPHIISSFSHIQILNLRDNKIESLPTFSKRCNLLRFLTHLDLGRNLLKLIPSSFLGSISFKTESEAENQSIYSQNEKSLMSPNASIN